MTSKEWVNIVILGFYGHGNIGDEAMLKNMIIHIRKRIPNSKLFVAVPPDFIVPEYLKVFSNLGFMGIHERGRLHEADLLIVGGGDLGAGFALDYLIFARANKIKSVFIGASFGDMWLEPEVFEVNKTILSCYNQIYVRDNQSFKNTKKLGLNNSFLSTDIAIDIPYNPINKLELLSDGNIVLSIREVRAKDELRQINWVKRFLENIEIKNVILLPFCKEDLAFTQSIIKNLRLNIPILYDVDPEFSNYVISKSKLVVSIGRLHPLIFATSHAKPMFAVTYPEQYKYHKIHAWMDNFDQSQYVLNFGNDLEQFNEKWPIFINNLDNISNHLKQYKNDLVKLNENMFDDILKDIKNDK